MKQQLKKNKREHITIKVNNNIFINIVVKYYDTYGTIIREMSKLFLEKRQCE